MCQSVNEAEMCIRDRDRVPVLKRCRSLGLDPIFLGIDKKSNRETKRTNKKMSEYGLQLREKQKAKFIYGVLEKPFRNYYAKASKMNGMVGTNPVSYTHLSGLTSLKTPEEFARLRGKSVDEILG